MPKDDSTWASQILIFIISSVFISSLAHKYTDLTQNTGLGIFRIRTNLYIEFRNICFQNS